MERTSSYSISLKACTITLPSLNSWCTSRWPRESIQSFHRFCHESIHGKMCENEKIRFFEHKYRINSRSITREERLQLRHRNMRLSGTSTLDWCGYADDLILFTLDKTGLRDATVLLDEVFTNFGLAVNVTKTERMINCKYLQSEEVYPTTTITSQQCDNF